MTAHAMTPWVTCRCSGCVILADIAYGCAPLALYGHGKLATAAGRIMFAMLAGMSDATYAEVAMILNGGLCEPFGQPTFLGEAARKVIERGKEL